MVAEAHEVVGAFAEMLVEVREPAEMWPKMLLHLQDAIGFDAGYIAASWGAAMEGRGAVVEHDEPFLKLNLGRFLSELSPREVAHYTDRARTHREVWCMSREAELAVFNEVLIPTGMKQMLVRASVRHGNVAGFNLERRGVTIPFSEADLRLIDVVAPFLHIVEVLTLEAQNEPGLHAFAATYGLSKREEELVELVARGLQNGEIALLIRVSVNTVRNTLAKVFDKVGVSTRSELTYLATQFHRMAPRQSGAWQPTPRRLLPDDGIDAFRTRVQRASEETAGAAPSRMRSGNPSRIVYTAPLPRVPT